MTAGDVFRPYQYFTEILVVPGVLCRYRGISAGAKLTWGRLARYQGETGAAFPSMLNLANELGLGATQARTYVRDLVEHGFLRIEERAGKSSVYEFLWHEAFDGVTGARRKAPPLRKTVGVEPLRFTEPHPSGKPEATPPVNRRRRESLKRITEENIKTSCSSNTDERMSTPPSPAKEPDPRAAWFTAFWSSYWRKVGRGAAEKAFRRAVTTETTWRAVQEAIDRQTPAMLAREVQFRPHASTWLNQERWMDEPEQPTLAVQRVGPAKDRFASHQERVEETFHSLLAGRFR